MAQLLLIASLLWMSGLESGKVPFVEQNRASASATFALAPGMGASWSKHAGAGKDAKASGYPAQSPGAGRSTSLVKPQSTPVLPPWYTFLGSVAALVVAGMWRGGWTRASSARAQARELAAIAEERDRLAALEEARSRFFAEICHEFRTPLTHVNGMVDLLRAGRYGELPPKAVAALERMQRNGARLEAMIDELLMLARLSSGEHRIEVARFDVAKFVRTCMASWDSVADAEGISLVVETPETLFWTADPDAFEHILNNLVENAIKFTLAPGTIQIGVRVEAQHLYFVVADEGIGIAPELQAHIFERYYQGETAPKRERRGMGVGLALVKELVHLHGGEIKVMSAAGVGSTFEVVLPLYDQVSWSLQGEEVRPPSDVVETPTGQVLYSALPHVLIVEDNQDLRQLMRETLEPEFQVVEAADGEEGLRLIHERLPDLVLADVVMPNMDGLTLLRAIKEDPMTAGIPVMLVTARSGKEAETEGLQAGAEEYVLKPFQPETLLLRVKNRLSTLGRPLQGSAAVHPVDVSETWSPFLQEIYAVIDTRLYENGFGVEALAEALGMHRSHLARRLRNEIGQSPVELIRRRRLEWARTHLQGGFGNVSEVCYAVGFESLSYFSKVYRDQFGTLPSQDLHRT